LPIIFYYFDSVPVSAYEVQEPVTADVLKALIERDVAKQIVKVWFPYDAEKKEYSLHVIHGRGAYSATDEDVMKADATKRGRSELEEAGEQLIGRSYIVVYEFYDVKTLQDKNSSGYEANVNLYLFKLDGDSAIINTLYDKWTDPTAIDKMEVSVKHIASIVNKGKLNPVQLTQSNDPNSFLTVSDEELFSLFAGEISKRADVYLTKVNEDFKVKAPVYKVNPIRAKIGLKEGVTVDQRYFAYETEADEDGKLSSVRKGVVRATSKITPNNVVATGEGDSITVKASKTVDGVPMPYEYKISSTSIFYQTHGRRIEPGFILQQKPDWGVGVSVLAGLDLTVLAELSAGMWLTQYVPALAKYSKYFPYGLKIYGKLALPFTAPKPVKITTASGNSADCYLAANEKGISIGEDNKANKAFLSLLNFGASKDFYFARRMALTPYVGVSMLLVTQEDNEAVKSFNQEVVNNGPSTIGLDLGVNYTLAILHNFQLIGNVGFNSTKMGWFEGGGITAGAGLRVQF
jgi:hypothetical protein